MINDKLINDFKEHLRNEQKIRDYFYANKID